MPPTHMELESFVRYSKYFGSEQISTKEIYREQDPILNRKLIQTATRELTHEGSNRVSDSDFYLGCVDFMLEEVDGDIYPRIIEANGGSSRGISSLAPNQYEACHRAYLQTLEHREDGAVLIGHPADDKMLYEKALLTEDFIDKGLKYSDINNINSDTEVILASYDDLIPKIELKNDKPTVEDREIDIIIGDGVVRRHRQLTQKTINNNLDAVTINSIFPVTDDKSATYKAQEISSEKLESIGVKPIDFTRAYNKQEIIHEVEKRVERQGKAIIKPSRGSGGRGIEIIRSKNEIETKVEESLREFGDNFLFHENPYPYTVSEVVDSKPIEWGGANRNFDMRVYVVRNRDRLAPAGGLVRVALEPRTSNRQKASIVVNLSGYKGIDMHRGLAINQETLEKLDTTPNEFKKIYKSAVIMFTEIINNKEELVEYAVN